METFGKSRRAILRSAVDVCAIGAVLASPHRTTAHEAAPVAVASAIEQGAAATSLNRVQPTRIPLDASLSVNGKFTGSISIAVDAAGDGEIDARRLVELLGPIVDPAIRASLAGRIAGRARVDFTELIIDDFRIAFDPLTLDVVVTLTTGGAAISALRLGSRQAMPDPTAFDQPEDFSAGINIAATQRYVHARDGGFERVQADFNSIINFGGFEGITLTGGLSYTGELWERREIRATRDIYAQALRAIAGEFTPSSTSFQGSGRILGLGLERAYSMIRPFQNTRPIGRQDFTLERASSVDVFVNQIRVQTIRLEAGRYDIGDFPFAAGPNQVKLVVEDVGGRREIVNFDIFSSAGLLTPGTTEFGGAVGVREKDRLNYGFSLAATGYGYRGLTDNLTLGINGQATNRGAQAGAAVILGTPLGFLQFETAASKNFDGGGFGTAASLDYRGEFSLRRANNLRLNASTVYRSAAFQDAFSSGIRNQTVLQSAVLAQWQAPFSVSLGLGYGFTKVRRSGTDVHRVDATVGRSFGRFGLNGTVSRSKSPNGRGQEYRAAFGLSARFGPRNYADMRYDSGTRRKEFEVSRSSNGQLNDISGSIRYTDDRDGSALSGRLAYINNRFDLVVNHNRLESRGPDGRTSNASDWNLSSFVGYAGGAFGIGRSVNDSFIVAPVHRSLKGAQASIMSGDRVVARSGFFGPALIPINRAYGVNRYDVKVDPLPIGYDLGSGTIDTFPGFGSGYKAMIGSDASRIAVGFLVDSDGPVALAGGLIEPLDPVKLRGWAERSFFTNRAGRFVADRLAPGRYRLIIGGKTAAEFAVPDKGEGLIDVGTIRANP